jgi:deoxyinosine 3'endonuclease (endonuclease V)
MELIDMWAKEQQELKKQLILTNLTTQIKIVAGLDISVKKSDTSIGWVGLVIYSYPDLKMLYKITKQVTMDVPYVSGYLAFREVPHYVKLLNETLAVRPELKPDVILIDGNGILHNTGFGCACHLGVISQIPTIGVAKKFYNFDDFTHDNVKDKFTHCKSDRMKLITTNGDTIACVFRPITSSHLLYISQGYGIDLDLAVTIVQHCSIYRVPEPIRQADLITRELARK